MYTFQASIQLIRVVIFWEGRLVWVKDKEEFAPCSLDGSTSRLYCEYGEISYKELGSKDVRSMKSLSFNAFMSFDDIGGKLFMGE